MPCKKAISVFIVALMVFAGNSFNAVRAADSAQKIIIMDVALNDEGTLQGQVVDLQNRGQSGIPLVFRSQNRDVVQTVSADNGQFAVKNLNGGVYNISTANGDNTFRFWAPRTAPPNAANRAIVYVQNPGGPVAGGGIKAVLGHPLILPAVIATAIAVPVAISSSHHPASP
jgi:hypothetical protein